MMIRARAATCAATVVLSIVIAHAHDGPPFPILSDHTTGPYLISIWTDPDTTDDGSAGGQFWVRVHRAGEAGQVPQETRATVTIEPMLRAGPARRGLASPVRGDVSNQFAALVMDHEGRFAVRVAVEGPLGTATVDATADATYDVRPPRGLLAVYLAPFLLVGLLWGRLLIRRRRMQG
jgi:hypothetical protein